MKGSRPGLLALAALAAAATAAASASASETIAYSYDARGRLVSVQHSGSVNGGVATAYSYDKADNRTLKTTSGGTPTLAQCLIASPAGPALVPIPICKA